MAFPPTYIRRNTRLGGRVMAAVLCRKHTSATQAELSELFGLGHPDSAANLARRAQLQPANSPTYRRRIMQVEHLLKTENQV